MQLYDFQGAAHLTATPDRRSVPGRSKLDAGLGRIQFFLLGGLMATLLVCYLAVCGCGWFLLGHVELARDEPDTLAPDGTRGLATLQTAIPTDNFPARLPATSESETAGLLAASRLPQRDLLALASRLQGLSPPPSGSSVAASPAYSVGDTASFWLHDPESSSFFTATARMRYATPHAYWWIQEGYYAPEESLEQSALNFENQIYPTNRRIFGSEWNPGVDGDSHIYIFLGNVPGVGGYFSGPDEYPVQISPHSNQHEMFYVDLHNASPGDAYFDGILAHEYQHMIHWAMDRDEDSWVNEGLSELAGLINGYDVGSTDLLFSISPDTQLNAWPEMEDAGPHYGASYLFLSYFLEQYGQDAIRQLVAEPANGIAGFEAVVADLDSTGRRFDDLFADWLVANYLDSAQSSPLPSSGKETLPQGHYGYADLDVRRPSYAAEHTTYPVHSRTTVHQYAADYILLQGEGNLTLEFQGTSLVSLVGNETHSGEYQWWSNRGDEADSTLSRTFDLTGLDQARLQVWMWYDLETDFDYAYVQVSADGGQTWHLLSNEHTTLANPNGSSYGAAFTGSSGGGDSPTWVQESFDLSPFAGRPLLVRFEVITDESVNHPGLCLDDVAIPELGYHDDVEAGDGGWQAEGWVRVADRLPQGFLVQLITLGQQTRVEQIVLDRQMHGTTTVTGLGQEVDSAVLVVSGMTPFTTEPATYSYDIRLQ